MRCSLALWNSGGVQWVSQWVSHLTLKKRYEGPLYYRTFLCISEANCLSFISLSRQIVYGPVSIATSQLGENTDLEPFAES